MLSSACATCQHGCMPYATARAAANDAHRWCSTKLARKQATSASDSGRRSGSTGATLCRYVPSEASSSATTIAAIIRDAGSRFGGMPDPAQVQALGSCGELNGSKQAAVQHDYTPPSSDIRERHTHKHLNSLHLTNINTCALSSLLHCEAGHRGRTAHDNEMHAHDKRGQQQRQEQPQGYLACARTAHQADVKARPHDVAGPAPTLLRLPPPRPASMFKGGACSTDNTS